ncbi:MAG TPA: hypothetical protein PLQ43_02815 [Deltaproteobacteria bacterium]|nr:hypothetical protein [Deltaproteobacteria bacterium]
MKKILLVRITWTVSVLAVFLLLGNCDNGGGNGSAEGTTYKEGTFVDSPVVGLMYQTNSISGLTDSNGHFKYYEGETITFKIGGVVLGQAVTAKSFMTPIDLVPGAIGAADPTVTNICILLQSLDNDSNPYNGIVITDAVRTAMEGIAIDFHQSTSAFVNSEAVQGLFTSIGHTLVSPLEAQNHLKDTLGENENDDTTATMYDFVGTWSTGEGVSETNPLIITINGNQLVGVFPPGGSVLTGTVSGGLWTYTASNPDPGDPDCANWSVTGTGWLEDNLTELHIEASGIFCSHEGGSWYTFNEVYYKQHDQYEYTYSGSWEETDGDYGIYTMTFTQTDTTFAGYFYRVKYTHEGGSDTYTISGTRVGNSYQGTDSRGRDFVFEIIGGTLRGTYYDPNGGETGSLY